MSNEVKLTQERYNRFLDMEDKIKQQEQTIRKLEGNIANLNKRVEELENKTRPYDDIFKHYRGFGN